MTKNKELKFNTKTDFTHRIYLEYHLQFDKNFLSHYDFHFAMERYLIRYKVFVFHHLNVLILVQLILYVDSNPIQNKQSV